MTHVLVLGSVMLVAIVPACGAPRQKPRSVAASQGAASARPVSEPPDEAAYRRGLAMITNDDPADDSAGCAAILAQAERGLAAAQYDAGVCYERGVGFAADQAQAAMWLERAAEQGHVNAEYKIAYSYQNGRGVVVDKGKALAWYRKAAAQGDHEAAVNAGLLLVRGDGVPADRAAGAALLESAAQKGEITSRVELAYVYSGHYAGPVDDRLAYRWIMTVAPFRRYYAPAARAELDARQASLAAPLTPDEIAAERAEAEAWLRRYPDSIPPGGSVEVKIIIDTKP
jgi:uncharacterized protein